MALQFILLSNFIVKYIYEPELARVWIMVLCHGSERCSKMLSIGPTRVTEACTKIPSIATIASRPVNNAKQIKNLSK